MAGSIAADCTRGVAQNRKEVEAKARTSSADVFERPHRVLSRFRMRTLRMMNAEILGSAFGNMIIVDRREYEPTPSKRFMHPCYRKYHLYRRQRVPARTLLLIRSTLTGWLCGGGTLPTARRCEIFDATSCSATGCLLHWYRLRIRFTFVYEHPRDI